MNLKQINNLTELFFDQFNKQIDKNKILLSTLGDKRKNYSWQETHDFINLVSNELRKVKKKYNRKSCFIKLVFIKLCYLSYLNKLVKIFLVN